MITSRLLLLTLLAPLAIAFTPATRVQRIPARILPQTTTTTQLSAADLDVVALVAGQENYGLAIVAVGEGLWSYAQAPGSISHAARVLLPTCIAAAVLVLGSGPLITGSGADAASMATGLSIATLTSVALGVSYALRLAAPYAPAPKEVAAVGLLIAAAGFFSFAQNLLVNGFVTLPSLPSIDLPSIELPDVGGLLG